MNFRRFDEMRVEADLWLRELQESFQELMMGDRIDENDTVNVPDMANMPEEGVINANSNSTQAAGL